MQSDPVGGRSGLYAPRPATAGLDGGNDWRRPGGSWAKQPVCVGPATGRRRLGRVLSTGARNGTLSRRDHEIVAHPALSLHIFRAQNPGDYSQQQAQPTATDPYGYTHALAPPAPGGGMPALSGAMPSAAAVAAAEAAYYNNGMQGVHPAALGHFVRQPVRFPGPSCGRGSCRRD